MDLDAFTKGKTKGAKNAWDKGGKNKGKDGKGKDKRVCYACGLAGHMQSQCPKGKGKKEKQKTRAKVAKAKLSATSAGDTATMRPIAQASP
eukprot:1370867-Amphidinium_carterae.1